MGATISTIEAPKALGPYSQAVRAGGFLFTAGQLGLDPLTGDLRDSIVAQTEQVMNNLAAVLRAAGVGFKDVVKSTIFLVDMGDFQAVNAAYGARFPHDAPARSTVQVAALPKGGLVEIELIAHLGP